jgi:DNA polymerase-3 subunit epsilon
MTYWNQGTLLAFDTETTGLDRNHDRIVTAGVVLVRPGEETVEELFEINPGIPIPEEAAEIHGVDDQQAAQFAPASEQIPNLIDYLERGLADQGPLIVFNAPYDLTMLDREAQRYGVTPLQDRLDLQVIDPLVIDRGIDPYRPGPRTLSDMAATYQVLVTSAHNAVADALASARVAWRLQQRYPELRLSAAALHRQQIVWADSFAAGLQLHRRSEGSDEIIDGTWPLQPGIADYQALTTAG